MVGGSGFHPVGVWVCAAWAGVLGVGLLTGVAGWGLGFDAWLLKEVKVVGFVQVGQRKDGLLDGE